MAAIFYNYSDDNMFKNSVSSGAAPISTNLFEDLQNENMLCIISQISITHNDVVQFFMTFDDFIHHYYFGKGVGSISISGMIFTNCQGGMPGLLAFYQRIANVRGKEVIMSTPGVTFTGVLLDCNVTMVAEPETMASFTANFAMVNSNLSSPTFPSSC